MSQQPKPTPTVRLVAGEAELTVLPADGCRVGSFRLGGTELLRTASSGPHGYGSFPMVPWAGRTGQGTFLNGVVRHRLPVNAPPHAIHGTGVGAEWRHITAASSETSAVFVYDLADPWPYKGRVTQAYELAPGSLSMTLCVETSDESFPAQVGWHPWFLRHLGAGCHAEGDSRRPERQRTEGATLTFFPAWQEELGPDHLPTGRRLDPVPGPWDDCFGMPDGVDVTITWPGRVELRITSSARWVVVYDREPDALCVEPQTGPPNGLNIAPRLVTPIDPVEASATWAWRTL